MRYGKRMRRRLAILARRARDVFPLTNLGILIGGVAAATHFLFAVPEADYALRIASILAMALVTTALVIVSVGAIVVFRELRGEQVGAPLRFEAERGFSDGLSLPIRWLGPLLEVRWTWEIPHGMSTLLERTHGVLQERLESYRRQHAEWVERRFVVEDGFGLARIVFRRSEKRRIRVLPYTGNLDRAPLRAALAAGDALSHPGGDPIGDRVDMRRYVPGDPLRLAMWKIYARTRQLMVRTPERALSPAMKVVGYLVSAVGDEGAAAAARICLERGLLGDDWAFSADGADRAAYDTDQAVDQVMHSRTVRQSAQGGGAGLASFVEGTLGAESGRLILFLPARHGSWLETVERVIRQRAPHVTAVVVADGIDDGSVGERTPRARNLVFRPEGPREVDEGRSTSTALRTVQRRLRRAGAEVALFDRRTGAALAGEHSSSYARLRGHAA